MVDREDYENKKFEKKIEKVKIAVSQINQSSRGNRFHKIKLKSLQLPEHFIIFVIQRK